MSAKRDVSPGRGYEESTEAKWTQEAFEALQEGRLHGAVIANRGVLRSRVWGPCPACGHDLDDRQTHTGITGIYSGEWRGTTPADDGALATDPAYYEVDVSCGCGHGHPGAPDGRAGCGVSFRVALLIQADASRAPA
jgi:hypothetical protein